MKNNRYVNGHKISLLSYVSTLSISLLILLILFMLSGIGLYIWMAKTPVRFADVIDEAGLFTDAERDELSDLAEQVSREKNINVFIVTRAMDDGSGADLSYDAAHKDTFLYAKTMYNDRANVSAFKDNSGFLFLIDMENRLPHFFSEDRVYARFSDAGNQQIVNNASDYVGQGDYAGSVRFVLNTIQKTNLNSGWHSMIQFLFVAGPLLTTLAIWLILRKKGRGKSIVSSSTYMKNLKLLQGDADTFTHKTVSVSQVSSSSGSSGGGGGSRSSGGGGGGGGRSGGSSGSRF